MGKGSEGSPLAQGRSRRPSGGELGEGVAGAGGRERLCGSSKATSRESLEGERNGASRRVEGVSAREGESR